MEEPAPPMHPVGSARKCIAESDEISFEAPEKKGSRYTIDAAYIRERLADIVKSEDLSRYILSFRWIDRR